MLCSLRWQSLSYGLKSSVVATQPLYLRRECLRLSCIRLKSTAASPVPPPQPNETIVKSEGLNPQLHPTGRPPLNPTVRSSSIAADIFPSESSSPPPTAGYRTPLRTTSSNSTIAARDTIKVVYEGPLRKAVRGLKAFSISSLILSASVTPFILTMEANLPMLARVALVSTGMPPNDPRKSDSSTGSQRSRHRFNSLFPFTLCR